MSGTSTHLVDEVLKKIESLYREGLKLKESNTELRQQLAQSKQEIEILSKELASQKERVDRLKLSKALAGHADLDKKGRSQIDQMIKEIDRCIALLNN